MRKKLRVAGYARVSTDEQKKYGYSIQAQAEEITQWCNDNGHDLIHIYIDEGFSASNMKRPQLQAMLSNLRDLDAIAFTRLDRLSRNVLLKNEFYAGSYRGNSNYAEPYITKETYNAVQTALQSNIRTGIQRHVYLFTGLLRCPECRSKLVGVSHPKGGKRYYYYRCNNAHSVHTCIHKKHYAELATEKYLLSNLDNLLKDHIATISSITSETKNTTEKELKELRKELDNLNYIFIKKRMPVSTYERLYAETEDKIKRLESFKPKSTEHLNQFLNSSWRSIYDNLTRENKRTLWRNILDSAHVSPDGIEVFFK